MPTSQWDGLSQPCDILVVKLSALGDVVHALGAVSIVKRKTNCKLWWLVKPSYLPLFQGVSFVDELITPADISRYFRRFELVIDLQGLFKTGLYTFWLGKRRFGFSKEEVREKAASIFYTDRVSTTSSHVVEKLRELVCEACDIENDGVYDFGLKIFEDDFEGLEGLLPERYVLIVPGAAWSTKRLSEDWCLRFYALARVVLDIPILFLPGLGESCRFKLLSDVLLPELPLRKAIAVISRASVVVAPDTGFLHIAAALGVPCVGLYCASSAVRNGPFPLGEVVECGCPSRGCFKRACHSLCTESIEPSAVLERVVKLLCV